MSSYQWSPNCYMYCVINDWQILFCNGNTEKSMINCVSKSNPQRCFSIILALRNYQRYVVRFSSFMCFVCFILLPRDAIASSVFALVVCPSVCHKPVLQRNDRRVELSLAWDFLPPILHCVIKIVGYLQKAWYFPGLRGNFATTSQSCCQQNSSTVELVDHTTTVDASWLFTAHRSTVTL